MKRNRGMILIACYLVIAVLLVLGSAFIYRSISENSFAQREKNTIKALYIAEAGIEQALYDLKQDFETGDPWRDGDINNNSVIVGGNNTNFYSLYGSEVSFGNGTYTAELQNVSGKTDEIRVRATGNCENVTKTIETYCRMKNYSPWNNAIFAGTGASGSTINGNVDIRGSVHILGTGLNSTDLAIDMGGSANVGNNYQGIPSALSDRIPDAPTVTFNGEPDIESLSAEVRIKNGLAGLSGSATIGDSDSTGNAYKETVDGIYVTDGYAGGKGATNVYADNGTSNTYDLGDTISFPSLSDPYSGYATYQDYLRANALVIDNPAQLNELNNITPGSNFSYTDGTNTIAIDGSGNMTISGIVYIDGGTLGMEKSGPNKTITYSGQGTIFATGDVEINVNLLTPDSGDSFPSNVIGIMTPGDIEFDGANIDVMGAFYAEGEIEVNKQTDIAGTLVSNYFDIGNQVPSIYQVPDLFNNLPAGMISGEAGWIMEVIAWQEI